ncbi:tonsoku-like protein [Diadema antillarum]|uniref:tonsoku-like protein n=1 Tax=Diadema antillarum TaxID=105358 RepID=UPI003A8C25DE
MNNADRKELKQLERCKAKAQSSGKLKEEAEYCNLIGELLARCGEYQDAIKEHRQELQLSESLNDVIGAAVANRKIGDCYNELGEYSRALRHQRKHLSLAESDDNHLEQQRALATIGRTYLCRADNPETNAGEKIDSLQKAQEAFLRSLTLCDGTELRAKISEKELMVMRARLLLNLGLVHESLDSRKNAAHFIQKAIFIAEKHTLLEDLIRCHLSLGDLHKRAGSLSKAGRSMESALMAAKKLKNKEQESQCLCASADVFFQLGDFYAAKRSLRKAYKLGSQKGRERETLIQTLKTAIRCADLQSRLDALPEEDAESRLPLYEALGDLCCKVDSYKRAIEYYTSQLKSAEKVGKPPKILASIYVSLATTYSDDGRFQEAIEMYRHELRLREGNLKEETKTWLNVADMQERAGQEFEVINESYTRALECARKAQHPTLQVLALRDQLLLIEKHSMEHLLRPTQKMLRNLREEHDMASDDDLEVSDDDVDDDDGGRAEDSEQLQNSEDIIVDDLSDSDSGSDEEYDRPTASERVKRNKFSKLNEKGESMLHRACIAGNLKQVKKLVEQGHPLNPRDYCGWTPLHEACNYGYCEIVDVLVSAGADINDRGGDKCDGVTPLHDAVNCGNWVVAKLLISKGAYTKAKDSLGNTPLDALKTWLDNYSNEIDADTREECFDVARLLREDSPGDLSMERVPPVSSANSRALLLNSDLYDREEDSSQGSQMVSQRPAPQEEKQSGISVRTYQRRDSDAGRGDSGSRSRMRKRRSRDSSARDAGMASRRNAAMSLGDDSEDDSDGGGRDACEDEMSCDGDAVAGGGNEHVQDDSDPSRRRQSGGRRLSGDSLPEIEIGLTSSTGRDSVTATQSKQMVLKSRGNLGNAPPKYTNISDDENDNCDEDVIQSLYLNQEHLEEDVDQPASARQTYQDVMRNIGSAASRMSREPPTSLPFSQKPLSPATGALIPEEEYTGGDDWLINDLDPQPSKRRRMDFDGTFRSMPGTERSQRKDEKPHRTPSQFSGEGDTQVNGSQAPTRSSNSKLSRKSRPRQTKLTNLGVSVRPASPAEDIVALDDDVGDDDCSIEDFATQRSRRGTTQVSRNDHPVSGGDSSKPPLPGPSSMMRVQVKIQDKLFLVPVSLRERPSMQWLSEQAARRYYSQCGLRPKLSLCTAEGALFSPDDSVVDLLNNNEMVIGRVDSWDLPPLTERYRKACERMKTEEHPTVLSRLQDCQGHQQQHQATLDLGDLNLRPVSLGPLLSAVQCQYSLRQLLLGKNRLDDSLAPQLASALQTLPSLTHLDLSSNQLTSEGLRSVSDILEGSDRTGSDDAGSARERPLQMLEEFDLSYNHITDASALSLAIIVKHCPLLATLTIRSCALTAKFFQLHRHRLVEAFRGAKCLHTLAISYNRLGSTGVELLLGCLAGGTLQRLELCNIIPSQGDGIHLARHLATFFSQNINVENLRLSGCHLSDVDVDYLKRLHPSGRHWQYLDLSANPRLTAKGIKHLLHSLHAQGISISKLDLSACSLHSPVDPTLLEAIAKHLPGPGEGGQAEELNGGGGGGGGAVGSGLVELRMCGTGLNKVDKELLLNVWDVAQGIHSGHHIDAHRCIFFVTR